MRPPLRSAEMTPSCFRAFLCRRVLVTLVVLGLLTACGSSDPPPAPPLEIAVVDVLVRDQPIDMQMVGETLGSSDIPIRARVEGVLTSMTFIEGRMVEAGQALYTIDPEPFEAEVVEAEGVLAEAKTRLAKAKADLERIRPLAEINAVSQAVLDGAVAQYDAALGAVKSAKAQVQQATIRLGYTRITAPISGRIGITSAHVGEFVGREPNPVVLNFVSDIDPIRVRFAIDERTYLALARRLQELSLEAGNEPRKRGGLRLVLADGSQHPYRGRVVAMDAAVNPKTGTFTFEADFQNPEGLVLAGQFARVIATAETRKNAILVPGRAVAELQGNFRVYVIGNDGKVELRPVELGPVIGGLRIVESGLKPGEEVAVEIVKLRPGMTVRPRKVTLSKDGSIQDPEKDAQKPRPGAPASGGTGTES